MCEGVWGEDHTSNLQKPHNLRWICCPRAKAHQGSLKALVAARWVGPVLSGMKTSTRRLKSNPCRVHGEYQHLPTAGVAELFLLTLSTKISAKRYHESGGGLFIEVVKSFSRWCTALPLRGAVKAGDTHAGSVRGNCQSGVLVVWGLRAQGFEVEWCD